VTASRVPDKDTVYVLPTILRRASKISVSSEERLSCAVVESGFQASM